MTTKKPLKKVGQIWTQKNDDNKVYLRLGQEGGKKPEYNFTVELTVKDAEGNVVARQTNGTLSLINPRQSPNANQDALSKVPNLVFDVLMQAE